MDSSDLCYNLSIPSFSALPPLPEAYIASVKNQKFEYLEKLATEDTLKSAQIDIEHSAHPQLLEICYELKIAVLEKRFQPKKTRKPLKLNQLLDDPKISKLLLDFVHKKLALFYSLLQEHQYAVSYHAKRMEALKSNLLQVKEQPLEAQLLFKKIPEGITYAFTLQEKEKRYIPKNQRIVILLNSPSWILLNQKIYQIKDLNANKLKPFFQKDRITIDQKHLRTYLEKVIIPIIKKIEVQTEGFEINIKKEITAPILQVTYDFIQKLNVIKVSFAYEDHSFEFHHAKQTASQVHLIDDEIHVVQTQRNTKTEKEYITSLLQLGLSCNPNLLFQTSNAEDPFDIIFWIKKNQQKLQKLGFEVKTPLWEDQPISMASHNIIINTKQEKDWFDIQGKITVGDQEIPFAKLIPNIRKEKRQFLLPNGEVFIIPIEWMNNYKKIADFSVVHEQQITLKKSNYMLLKEFLPSKELHALSNIENTDHPYVPSVELKATLRPYQLEGVQWLVNHNQHQLGACLADDMGLGKTLQTIATLTYAKDQLVPENQEKKNIVLDLFSDPLEAKTFLKSLIVLPASLVFNWAEELNKFAPSLQVLRYTGKDRHKTRPYLDSYDVILTTYATVVKDLEVLIKHQFNYLILDESQQIKNKNSKIFSAINQIQTQHKISLSGTPIENSLADLWSQMEFINPGVLGNFDFFNQHFRIPIEKNKDEDKIASLKTIIDPFILRRTKEQVAKDLPQLSEQIHYCIMHSDQEKSYESEKSAARNTILGIQGTNANKIHILNTLTKLRQLANHPQLINQKNKYTSGKFEEVTHYLQTLAKSGKKALIFSSFVSHLDIYKEWCQEQDIPYSFLTGNTPSKDRAEIVHKFQNDQNILFFFISLKAGGVGLNLTKASYVLLLDPWWNPFIEKQAIARAHRIGQENNVLVTRFITKNTIEEKIIQLQENKKVLSDHLIETNSIPTYVENELEQLLN